MPKALTAALLRALVLGLAAVLPAMPAAEDTAVGGARAGGAPADAYALYESDSSFEDLVDGLKLAIEERGMYINGVMHMDEMLARTGKDLGLDETLYTQAQSIEFCSALLSRKMAAESPARIVNCPFIIAVYTLPEDPDTSYLVHRRIPAAETEASAVMREIADMLEAVAAQALSW